MVTVKKMLVAAAAAVVLMASAGNADATFSVRVFTNTTTNTANDNNVPAGNLSDSDSTALVINSSTFLITSSNASFSINGFGADIGGTNANFSVANLTANVAVTALNGASTTITFEFTRDGYTAPPSLTRQINNSIGGSSSSPGSNNSVTYQSWVNAANTGTFETSGVASNPLNLPVTAFGSTGNSAGYVAPTGAAYSITTRATFTFTSLGSFQFTGTTNVSSVVPAPAGLLLGVLGLPALGLARRLRRTTPVAA